MAMAHDSVHPAIIRQRGEELTAPADTAENILAAVVVPAMRANSRLEIWSTWEVNNNSNVKTPRIRFGGIGGTAFLEVAMANMVSLHRVTVIQNANSTGAQISGFTLGNAVGFGNGTGSLITSSVDTTGPVEIVFTAQKATAGDTIKLRSFKVVLSDGN